MPPMKDATTLRKAAVVTEEPDTSAIRPTTMNAEQPMIKVQLR